MAEQTQKTIIPISDEMVVRVAQALCDEADPDVIDGAWVVSDTHYWALKAALDADAPGGG